MDDIQSFEDEAQAYEEIAAMGFHAMAIDFPPEENELHWHDFDSVVYVTAGEVTLSLENGESATCQRGAKIVASAGVAHREKTSGYSAMGEIFDGGKKRRVTGPDQLRIAFYYGAS